MNKCIETLIEWLLHIIKWEKSRFVELWFWRGYSFILLFLLYSNNKV